MIPKITSQALAGHIGISALSPEKQEAVLVRVADLIFQSVLIRCVDALSVEQKNDLEKLLSASAADPDALYEFLHSNVKNFDDIVRAETEYVIEESGKIAAIIESA